MNNQEAIKMLKYNSNVIHKTINGETDINEVEALDMAISALQEQELKQELKREVKNSGCTYKPDCPWYDGSKCNSPNDHGYHECDYDRGIFPESYAEELSKKLDKENGDLQPTCNNLATDAISRTAVIDTEGLDEEVRCAMCRNQMKTDRGCDGNCKYDEKLYEKIMQILNERIKPLPSAQPEQKWIPCKTGILPEKKDEFYQATYLLDDGDRMVDYVYFNSKGMWSNYAYEYSELLAWMPLPEAYKGDK